LLVNVAAAVMVEQPDRKIFSSVFGVDRPDILYPGVGIAADNPPYHALVVVGQRMKHDQCIVIVAVRVEIGIKDDSGGRPTRGGRDCNSRGIIP
jgi:hypothetical protein